MRHERLSQMPLSNPAARRRLVALLLCFAAVVGNVRPEPAARTREDDATLVVYSYRHQDPDALDNLQYFVSNVLKPQDAARYLFIVDHAMQQHGHMSSHGLPKLPSNAEYLTIRDCFELGHVGKVLLGDKSSVHVNLDQYKYFVWLDSSAKGPLLPSHTVQGDRAPAWHTLLTSRLTANTKLVGANIVCQPVREVMSSVPSDHTWQILLRCCAWCYASKTFMYCKDAHACSTIFTCMSTSASDSDALHLSMRVPGIRHHAYILG